jgi:hypothetical protein
MEQKKDHLSAPQGASFSASAASVDGMGFAHFRRI